MADSNVTDTTQPSATLSEIGDVADRHCPFRVICICLRRWHMERGVLGLVKWNLFRQEGNGILRKKGKVEQIAKSTAFSRQ